MCCENKVTKRNYFSKSSTLLYDQIIFPRTSSSSIEMPESGYNTVVIALIVVTGLGLIAIIFQYH